MTILARLLRLFRSTRRQHRHSNQEELGPLQGAAMSHLQAGRLLEAEDIYRQLLGRAPQNANTLHMLGVIAQRRGDSAEAAKLLRQAVFLDPANPAAFCHLGSVLRTLGQIDAAHSALDRALDLSPHYPEALNSRGCLYQLEGNLTAAVADFSGALKSNPAYVNALYNLGNIQRDLGELDQAENCYQRVLAIKPDLPEAYNSLGNLYQQRGRLEQAEVHYRRALALRADYAEANNDYGTLLVNQGRMSEAEARFRFAIGINPVLAEAHNNLGDVLQAMERLEEAKDCIQNALNIRPGFAEAFSNLGLVYRKMGQFGKAEDCIKRALALQPSLARAYVNLGMLYHERGAPADAETYFRRALALAPESSPIKYNLAIIALLRGDYDVGLELYESRLHLPSTRLTGSISLHAELQEHPRWQGEHLAGRRLLVWTEQGLGDSLMLLRYLPLLRQRGAGQVIVYCERELERLVREIPGVTLTVSTEQQIPFETFECHCPMMSLPYLFGTRLDSIPNGFPYLIVPEALRKCWSERLASISGLKVGLVWAGSSTLQANAQRSISLNKFEPLLELTGIRWISLQKGEESRQLRGLGWAIADWMDECQDFMDTAALVANLDLVISVDTAVAHLAGALGKPVWLLNRHGSEWRWGQEREDSAWYPTMHIFRQTESYEWGNVILRVKAQLEKLATENDAIN